MNYISFPILDLEMNISRIAISFFKIDIYWYAILIVTAIVISILLAKRKNGLYDIKYDDVLDLLLYVLPISILCARLFYCIFNFAYYFENPIQILNFRNGGLAIYGGIIGGAITCFVFCKKRKINLLDLFDYITPLLALSQAIGRWGNFINCEAYGIETNLPWRMGIFENNIYKEVHPTFLYESIVTFSVFVILSIIQRKRRYKGEITYLYLVIYSFFRMLIEGLRIDSLMFYNFRISQMLSLFIFVIFCIILIKKEIKNVKSK